MFTKRFGKAKQLNKKETGGTKTMKNRIWVNAAIVFLVLLLVEAPLVQAAYPGSAEDTTPPAAITNLRVEPWPPFFSEVVLKWTAPGDDGSGGGTASQYDIRYYTEPITNANWDSAWPVIGGPPSPLAPGSQQEHVVDPPNNSTRWYFAIKTADEVPNWSELSNTPSIIDTGFRQEKDDYKFKNWGGKHEPDFTINDMRRMFGDTKVCQAVIAGVCIPKPSAREWRKLVHKAMKNGHCSGFTTTSLRFFTGRDTHPDSEIYEMEKTSNVNGAVWGGQTYNTTVRRHISFHQTLEYTCLIRQVRKISVSKGPKDVLDDIYAILGDILDPAGLLYLSNGSNSAHAVVPYAIEDRGNGQTYFIWVYDSNSPGSPKKIRIDTVANTWSSNLDNPIGSWVGSENSHTLGVIPTSIYDQQSAGWTCSGGGVWLSGAGHLLITNSQGQRIGFVGTQFIDEIPDASATVDPGGLGTPTEPTYSFDTADTRTILLNGQTVTQTETVEVTQFGPGYAAWVDDVTLEPASQDQLVIAPDGTQLAYHPNNGKEITMTLALDGTSESNQLQVNGADIGAGQVVTLTADVGNDQLVFNNAQADGGEYDLNIVRASTVGEQKFFHAGVVISATDTHYVDYGVWDGSGPMTLQVDHESNGSIDETLVLDNQVREVIYLPIILKNY